MEMSEPATDVFVAWKNIIPVATFPTAIFRKHRYRFGSVMYIEIYNEYSDSIINRFWFQLSLPMVDCLWIIFIHSTWVHVFNIVASAAKQFH